MVERGLSMKEADCNIKDKCSWEISKLEQICGMDEEKVIKYITEKGQELADEYCMEHCYARMYCKRYMELYQNG